MTHNELLKAQGYVVIPQVLSQEEVRKARSILTQIFSKKSNYEGDLYRTSEEGGSVYIDIFSRYKELRWILFNPKFIEGLSSALGKDFVVLPDAAMHDSQYGGWHKDTTSQERNGHTFHYEQDFQVVTTAIYLQDNSAEYGGGLEVVPHSHTEKTDPFATKPTLIERIKNKLMNSVERKEMKFENQYSVPTKAGDMVIFNLRLTHRATYPEINPVPAEHRKFAIFTICSANNKHARAFTDYIKSRPDYLHLRNHKYPPELLEESKRYQINLMQV
jgi:hypothetical protein